MRSGDAGIGIADRQGIDEAGFEVRSDRRHEVMGIAAPERAMHALALTQHGVGDLDLARCRLFAAFRIGAERDDDRGMRRHGLARQVDRRQRQCAGERAERIVDEDAADVILLQQRLHGAAGEVLVAARQIDQVGAAIGGDDQLGLVFIRADEGIAGLRIGVVGDGLEPVVGIEQRQVERLGEIDGQESQRQETFRCVGIGALDGRGGLALLGDGREAVIRRNHDVGIGSEAEIVQRLAQLSEIVVGILDGGQR